MNTSQRPRAGRLVALVLVTLLLTTAAACGDDGDGDGGGTAGAEDTSASSRQTSDAPDEGAYPVTIEHSAGSTTIEARPERIVTLNVQWTDAVLAMGEQPVGYVLDAAGFETDPYPWQGDRLDGSQEIPASGAIPFEQIAALQPDLILATFLVTDPAQVETLQQIAPTIPNLTDIVDQWQDHIEVMGQVLGAPATADEVIADVEGQIAALAEDLPGLAGKSYVAANYVEGDGIYVVADPDDGAARLFYALGMEIAPAVLELEGAELGRVHISAERVSVLDADFIGVLTNGSDPSALPGWDQLPAVQTETVVDFEFADVVGLNTPSAVSLPYVMELMRPALELVAAT